MHGGRVHMHGRCKCDTRSAERPAHHGVYGVYATSDAYRLPNP